MAKLQRYHRNRTLWEATQSFLDVLYISIVREFRSATGGAMLAFLMAIAQPMLLFAVFWIAYTFLVRTCLIRGDCLLFIMTFIFLFIVHIMEVQVMKKSGGGLSGMIFYAKTSATLGILASAIHALYLNILAITVIMGTAYLLRGYLEVYDPAGLIGPFFFAWTSGLAVGVLFQAIAPLSPGFVEMLSNFYRRAQMFASGKMLLGNMVPAAMLPFFTWNPLFHAIDQARGAAFINYLPRNSDPMYPLYFTLVVIVLALIITFGLRAAQDRGIE